MEATSRKQSQAVLKKTLSREERIPYRGKPCFLGPISTLQTWRKRYGKDFTEQLNFFYEPLKICTYESLTQTINFLKNNLKVNWPLCEASALFLTVNWLSQDQLWSSWDDTAFHPMLTHFRPMFSPCRNQVVGFLLAKCLKNIFHRCFSNILLVKTNNLVYPYGLITPFLIHWIWNFPLKFPWPKLSAEI